MSKSLLGKPMRLAEKLILFGLLGLGACAAPSVPFAGLPRLSVSTEFDTQNLCDIGVSPAIRLGGVPDGTESYVIQITDINVAIQTPWRETVPMSSNTEIPEAAAKTYVGPCLGDFVQFQPTAPYGYVHRVEVLAQDANEKPLAYGSTTAYVLSPYLTAKRDRARLQQHGASRGAPSSAGVQPPPPAPVPGQFQTPSYMGFPSGVGPSLGVYR